MLQKYRIPLLVLVVLVQTAALAAMVAAKQWTLITGTPIVLETVDGRRLDFRAGPGVFTDQPRIRLALDDPAPAWC